MGRIRVLPDEVVSKIAAGEIVERPASVVKELVENSLDAASTSVVVEVVSGGKRLIRVADDGEGMSRDEALLSLERHATSKLRTAADLESIATFGFRGEALPSIASVSRFHLTTKRRGELVGTKITVLGGRLKGVAETGCAEGTVVEVRDLFYNVPARRGSLRSTATELHHVVDTVRREALLREGVGFELRSEGRTLLRLTPHMGLADRVEAVWEGEELFEVEGGDGEIRVAGRLSGPLSSRRSSAGLYLYVNGRAVRDRLLARTVLSAYGRMLEPGRFPQGVLHVTLPAHEVDVNVHPTKNEVRFRNPHRVGEAVRRAVEEMLRSAPWMKGLGGGPRPAGAPKGAAPLEAPRPRATPVGPAERAAAAPEPPAAGVTWPLPEKPLRAEDEAELREAPSPGLAPGAARAPSGGEEEATAGGGFGALRVVGQVGGLYIVCESPSGMIVIDQHAAHERINYERIKRAFSAGAPQSQELLVPLILELPEHEARSLLDCAAELAELGITIEQFGVGAIRVRSLPPFLAGADVERMLRDVARDLGREGAAAPAHEVLEEAVASRACRSSVMARDPLGREEMEALLRELDRCRFPHSCPHGRPVAREITYNELEKLFKRR